MRHRARHLHVLALAPVAAILAAVLGLTNGALAAPAKAPSPIVVTIDPAFGGQPTQAHPNTPFDPGAIGTNGLLEKDVDLDIANRLAALLRADLVNVVLTRTGDTYVSAARRRQISASHHAMLVVSVAADASADPTAAGSAVTYPDASSRGFAQTLGDALSAEIGRDGVPDSGIAEGDAGWLHTAVPAATVEVAYLSNTTEAALLATSGFRQDAAAGVRNGIEAYMPSIIARRDAIRAWRQSHHDGGTGALTPASAQLPGANGFQFGPVIAWLIGIALTGLILLFREQVARVLVVVIALVIRAFGGLAWLRRAMVRRRRRRQRERTGRVPTPMPAQASARSRGASIYDDIPL